MKPKIRPLAESEIADEMALQRRVAQSIEQAKQEHENPEPREEWEVVVRIRSTGEEVKVIVSTRALDPMAIGRSHVALDYGVELEDVRPVTSTWLREVKEEV